MEYEIVGRILWDANHFVTRFVATTNTPKRVKGVYLYDGLGVNGGPSGYSVKEAGGITKGLGGWNIDMPLGYRKYRTVTVIYKLRGGQKAQEWFWNHQRAYLKSTVGIQLSSSYSSDLQSQPILVCPGVSETPGTQMEWLVKSSRLKKHNYREYQLDSLSLQQPAICGTQPNPIIMIDESNDGDQTNSKSIILLTVSQSCLLRATQMARLNNSHMNQPTHS